MDLANELSEQFCRLQLSGYQWRILWVILRQTYGWHKKTERISLSTFEERTGIPQKHLVPPLNELVDRNIVIKDPSTYITTYGLQKNYELWKPLRKSGVLKFGVPEIGSPENGRGDLRKSGDIKENNETSKKIHGLPPGFAPFYNAFPKKKDRSKAEKAWKKLNPSPELQKEIMAAVLRQKETEDGKTDGGRYIPYPSTWLNGRRWEDEIQEARPSW